MAISACAVGGGGRGLKARVVIVDDEPRMAQAIAMALERDGHDCEVCTSGREALEAIEARGADVVVTDWRMPGMDGLELLRRLHEHAGRLPVILLTAHASVPSAVAAMRDGAFDYVTKPFDNDELRALVERAARAHPPRAREPLSSGRRSRPAATRTRWSPRARRP